MTARPFHLSLGVKSITESINFYTQILGCELTYESTEYCNLDFFGSQLTIKHIPNIKTKIPELHFGVNLPMEEFEAYCKRILATKFGGILTLPTTVEIDTNMERRKMYLQSPSGYIFEIKGYS